MCLYLCIYVYISVPINYRRLAINCAIGKMVQPISKAFLGSKTGAGALANRICKFLVSFVPMCTHLRTYIPTYVLLLDVSTVDYL